MTENWLITGGCGFIGSSLVRMLVAEGGSVRVFDDCSVGDPTGLPDGVELVRGSVTDSEALAGATRDIDIVCHLAAQTGVPLSVEDPLRDCEINVRGTLNALQAARTAGVKRFVFASSGAPAGEVTPPIHEEVVPRPVSPYGASKLAGEAYCGAYWRSFGLPTVALRFGNVYGPGSQHKTSVVARFIQRALRGEPLTVYGDGSQTRDYVYVGDLLDAIRKAATADGVGGEIFQIATATETSVSELTALLVEVLLARGIEAEVVHEAERVGDVARNFADTSKARSRLGWTARTPLREGLERTVDWYLGGGEEA